MAIHCLFFSVYLSWKQGEEFCEISYFEYIRKSVRNDKFWFAQMQVTLRF